MAKPGRPKKANPLDEYMEVRLSEAEKEAFKEAAELAGLALATWVRVRLRQVAARELEKADRTVAFLEA